MAEKELHKESLNYQLWQKFMSNDDVTKFLRDVKISQKFLKNLRKTKK